MDTNQPTTSTTFTSTSRAPGMFGTNIPSSVAFAIAILLFLLPFSEIRCGNQPLMNNTGLGFAMGSQWKIAGGYGKDMLKDMDSKTGGKKAGNTQYFIIGALALGLLGLVFSLTGSKTGSGLGIVAGVLGAGVLVAFMFDLKKWFNDGLAKQAAEKASEGTDAIGMGDVKMSLTFTPWFYIAIAAFIIAAVFCSMRMRSTRT